MSFKSLFKPGHIGTLKVKNRLVMPPMVRDYADSKGFVTDRYLAHIESIAKGGVGTMILEASFIRPDGKGFAHQLGIHTDEAIPGLRLLVRAAHKYGAAMGPQLYHAGRQTSQKTTGVQPLAPSPVADPTVNEVPRELKANEIKEIIKAYGAAAVRAKKAGCDFVEIHGAHGYLITQFLSPFSNKRNDEYGGTPEKRMKFALEVYESVRNAVGKDYPVLMRLSGEEMVPGGLTLKDTVKIAKDLEKAGVNGLHISVGNYASYAAGRMIPPMAVGDGPLVHLAAGVKKAVKIPVIAVAKIRSPRFAENIIKSNKADFVAIGRTLLADPEWPNKVYDGRLDEIMPCVACNQGCITRLFAQQDVRCTVNPKNGRELEFAKPATAKKKIVVVGGGPAGMQAAKIAAERGHKVSLYEKAAKLGGQLFIAAAAPHRQGWNELKEALERDIKRLKVDVHLGEEFTLALAKKMNPDAVILAMGSSAFTPQITGVENKNVIVSREILEGEKYKKGNIVTVGGGCAGAQTAEFLASKKNKVTIVEMLDAIAADSPVDERILLLERLKRLGVRTLLKAKVVEIGDKEVTIESEGKRKTLPADTVVLCLGSRPNNGLANGLKTVVKTVITVGDAKAPRKVTDAMAEGAFAVLEL